MGGRKLTPIRVRVVHDDEFNESMEIVKKFGYKVVKEANERL